MRNTRLNDLPVPVACEVIRKMGEITKDKVNQHIRENVKNKLPELFT